MNFAQQSKSKSKALTSFMPPKLQFSYVFSFHEGSDSDMDLSKELHPIGHYINDREEMLNQVLNCSRPDKAGRCIGLTHPVLYSSAFFSLPSFCKLT